MLQCFLPAKDFPNNSVNLKFKLVHGTEFEIFNIQSNEITHNIMNYLSRIFWSGMCSFLLAYNKGSCNILSHATFQSFRDCFLVKSASHAPASITIWWRKWSRMTWMGFFDFSLHSFTADDSLKLNLLSMSRLAKTSTFSKGKKAYL